MENVAEYPEVELNRNVKKRDSLKRFFIGIGKGSILTLSIFLIFSKPKILISMAKATDNLPLPIVEGSKRTWVGFFREKALSLFQSGRSVSVSDFAVLLGSISTLGLIVLLFMSKSIIAESESKQDLIEALRSALELCIKNSQSDPFN